MLANSLCLISVPVLQALLSMLFEDPKHQVAPSMLVIAASYEPSRQHMLCCTFEGFGVQQKIGMLTNQASQRDLQR